MGERSRGAWMSQCAAIAAEATARARTEAEEQRGRAVELADEVGRERGRALGQMARVPSQSGGGVLVAPLRGTMEAMSDAVNSLQDDAAMTTAATSEEYPLIAGYLARQGVLVNAWVIREVWWALRGGGSGEWSAVVHRRGGEVAGVMTLLRHPEPVEGREYNYDYMVRMEATDGETVLALLDTLPAGELGCFNTHSPRVQAALDHVPGMERYLGGPFMTVTEERFGSVAAEGVREVTSEDAALFEGLEQPPWDCEGEKGGRHFAVIRDGRAVARAAWIPLMEEPAFSPPIIRITYVATDAPYRRQGLGRQVLSHVTDLVLRAGARPMYWTSQDNPPSQGLARSLGYEEFARHICYVRPKVRS